MSTILHINLLQKDQGERPESHLLADLRSNLRADLARPYRGGLDWTCPVSFHVPFHVPAFGTKKPSNGGQIAKFNGGQATAPEVTP